jgi:tetratricopeptide (TPR) repeat protein
MLALLQGTPEERPPDADTVLRRIAALRSAGTASAPRHTRRRFRVVGGALLLALSAWGAQRYLSRRVAVAGTPDESGYRLVIADFAVSGLDPSLGRPLADEVRRFFGESRGSIVLSHAQVDSALRRMRYAGPPRVSPDLAREVAQREGAHAVLLGDLTPLGGGFLATLRVRSAATGEDWVAVSSTLQHPESELLPALGRLADSVQHRLQASGRAVPFTAPPRKLTTHSLHALQLVSQVRLDAPALPGQQMAMLREAIALDSTLAYAWLVIGNMLSGPYRTMLQDSAFTNMYRLREALTPFEQAQATGIYLTRIAWDRPGAMAAYDRFLADDPTDYRVILNAAQLLNSVREFERAESFLQRYRRALPGAHGVAGELVVAHLGQGNVAAADSIVRALVARQDTGVQRRADALRFRLATATQQYDSAARFADSYMRRAAIARVQGRLAEAHRLQARSDSIIEASWRVNKVVANPVYTRALREARDALWLRDAPRVALTVLDDVFTRHPIGRIVEIQHRLDAVQGATLYAVAGRPDRARVMLDTILARSDSLARRTLHPVQQQALGEIALAEGRVLEAMTHFRQGDLAADGLPASPCGVCVLPSLARTAERAGWADSARTFWTQYVTAIAVDRHLADQWYLRLAYRRLERLYAELGDTAQSAVFAARGAALWRQADRAARVPDALRSAAP